MLDNLTAREKVQAIYIAYLVSIVLPPLALVAVYFAYKLKREHQGSWLESHCNWQILTFWVGFAAFVVSVCSMWMFVGYLVGFVSGLWFLYRIIKGWLKLSENQTVEPKAFGLI